LINASSLPEAVCLASHCDILRCNDEKTSPDTEEDACSDSNMARLRSACISVLTEQCSPVQPSESSLDSAQLGEIGQAFNETAYIMCGRLACEYAPSTPLDHIAWGSAWVVGVLVAAVTVFVLLRCSAPYMRYMLTRQRDPLARRVCAVGCLFALFLNSNLFAGMDVLVALTGDMAQAQGILSHVGCGGLI
jgi:hypothetical protein